MDKDQIKDTAKYPGAAVDVADDEKVTAEAVKEYTKELNDNPRSDE